MAKNLVFVFPEIGKGGAEKVVACLGNYLTGLNYKVTFISLGPVHDYAFLNLAPAIEVLHFTRKSKFDFSSFEAIKQILEEKKISFIFCVDFFAQLMMALLRKRHHLNFDIIVNLHITKPKKKTDYLVNFLACRFLRRLDCVVFISKNQLKYIRARFLMLANCKVRTIYNGIDTNIFRILPSAEKLNFRKKLLDAEIDDILIIKVAGIRPEKDHETAIKALRYFHDNYTFKPILVILGSGDMVLTQELKQLAGNLHLNEYVKFIGFNTNVNEYVACCNLFTLTSNSVETFSLAALEAMSCGLPVVLTNIGGADEMVDTKVNGFLSKAKNPADIAEKWNLALNANFDKKIIRGFVVDQFDMSKMNTNYRVLFEGMEGSE